MKTNEKFITIKVLREQMKEINDFLDTEKGKRYVNDSDFIRQAINEKLEKLKEKKP